MKASQNLPKLAIMFRICKSLTSTQFFVKGFDKLLFESFKIMFYFLKIRRGLYLDNA